MKSLYLFLTAITSILIYGCGSKGPENISLTDNKIEAYLNSYKELREKAPDILSEVNRKTVDIEKSGIRDFEAIIKKNGLPSYKEFVIINAKVGAVYSILNAEDFMNVMSNMKTEGLGQMDEGMKQMQAQIDDPSVPVEAKEEIKKALEEMKKSKGQINNEFDKNKEWADLVLDKTKTITDLFIDKAETELVKQNFDKITEAYTGMAPSNFKIYQ